MFKYKALKQMNIRNKDYKTKENEELTSLS